MDWGGNNNIGLIYIYIYIIYICIYTYTQGKQHKQGILSIKSKYKVSQNVT